MSDKLTKAAVFDAFMQKLHASQTQVTYTSIYPEEPLDKPADIMDDETAQIHTTRDTENQVALRTKENLRLAKSVELLQPYNIVQTGALVLYKNGESGPASKGIYFAQPFVGKTVTVDGVKVAGASMNPSMQKALLGKKEGEHFNLCKDTYHIEKIL